jgi:hypothetical protein
MPLNDYSAIVGDALVRAFPQFENCIRVGSDTLHLEIHFPHPRAPFELFITTENNEIGLFLAGDHRHIGMNRRILVEEQIAQAQKLIAGLLSGTIPLVRDARWSKLKISDDPSIYGYDPDERLTFVTWDELGS